MIGRRCKHSNVFSRPVLIARNLSGKPDFKPRDLSQEIYCGGYISVDPPLPIPNREVKHTGADGSAIPSVRVGSCRFSRPSSRQDPGVSLFFIGAKPPQSPCALKVLYDFAGTKSLTPVDSILSMKRAYSVDKTARNAILSMNTPDFVDKVSAVLGVSLAWFRRSKFRLHPFANSRTRAVR